MRQLHALAIACQVALGLLLVSGSASATGLTLEQESEAGRGFFNAFREQYGVTENQQYRDLAESVLQRLARASGERPELQWRVAVLKYHPDNPVAKNASAWPGGYVITDEAFMKSVETASGGDNERAQALMAGVVAHEMAHVIRRDTDALVPLFFKQQSVPAPQLLLTLTSTDGPKTAPAEQREKENACDRHGAFYLLRAGYRIEDMINVFRHLQEENVDEVLFNSELDHARAGERVGNLLEVKSRVVEDERLFDEAVNILNLGLGEEMLRVAEENLAEVSRRFPTVLPVRHARAVLMHRRYLSKTPPQRLVCKPSFSFYRFRATRSLLADDYLHQAIREYEAILKDYEAEGHKGMGPTVAAYALALVHADQAEKAVPWAEKAVTLAPEDWNSYNVLGIALQQAGKNAEAVEQLQKAVTLAAPKSPEELIEKAPMPGILGDRMVERSVWRHVESQAPLDLGPALYNLGVALKGAGNKEAAAHAFRAYLATDYRSDWAQMALAQIREMGPSIPAASGALAPTVAGVQVGLPDIALRRRVGEAEGIATLDSGAQVWRYTSKGFSLFLDEGNRVRAGLLYGGYKGEIGSGVRLGVAAEQILKAWGEPIARAQVSNREAWTYPAQGLVFLIVKEKLDRVLWAPVPPAGGGRVQPGTQIKPGDSAAQVKEAVGREPDSGEGTEKAGGVWVYDDLGMRIRFDKQGAVALVTITRPSATAVAGVKLGDAPARIRQLVGAGFVSTDPDTSETYSFPDKGMAFIVRNAEVTTITLFSKQG